MNSDTFSLLIGRLDPANLAVHIAEISDDEMRGLSAEQAQELLARFGSNTLTRLPQREQQFFEWLRQHDAPVWHDLWGGDQEPYIVSLGYLNDLLPGRRGFLICSAGTACASRTSPVAHTLKFWVGARGAESGAAFTQCQIRIRIP